MLKTRFLSCGVIYEQILATSGKFKFQNANPRKIMKVRKFLFQKINAFIMTDWKAQGFFETMGNKDFRNFIYIDSSIAKPYLYDICLKCAC